jgi:hypothetical protein
MRSTQAGVHLHAPAQLTRLLRDLLMTGAAALPVREQQIVLPAVVTVDDAVVTAAAAAGLLLLLLHAATTPSR